MPQKTDLSTFNCSLARALGLVGDGWCLLILRDAFLGLSRFGEFERSLGLAKNILADRLDRLVAGGVLIREGEGRPRYHLTEKGADLLPAMIALTQWGDRWLAGGAPPMLFEGPDGTPVRRVTLEAGPAPLDPAALRVSPGPGADARTRGFLAGLDRKSAKPNL